MKLSIGRESAKKPKVICLNQININLFVFPYLLHSIFLYSYLYLVLCLTNDLVCIIHYIPNPFSQYKINVATTIFNARTVWSLPNEVNIIYVQLFFSFKTIYISVYITVFSIKLSFWLLCDYIWNLLLKSFRQLYQ